MASSSLDRSKRQASNKKKEEAEERKKVRAESKQKKTVSRKRRETKRAYRHKSAAHYDNRSMIRTMVYSAGILIIAFIVFEVLLLIWEQTIDFENRFNTDEYWHLVNIADTCIGFVIGLTAMDALTYIEQGRKSHRDEQRAIIRHNRIIRPCIDMYLARKNSLITPAGEDISHFKVITKGTVRDLKDMYGSSDLTSDAGKVKIEAYEFYLKKLNVAFLNMAEDINFDYNPEVCDAVMDFLNETTYGMAALEAVVSYGKEGNRTQRMNVIRQVKEAPDNLELSDINSTELNTAFILMHMIHAHEDALDRYMRVIDEIDAESDRRARKLR